MLSKSVVPALSLALCCLSTTSLLAESNLSEEECIKLSVQYDDIVKFKQVSEQIFGNCDAGGVDICTRTDKIQAERSSNELEQERIRLKNELTENCPSYAIGIE